MEQRGEPAGPDASLGARPGSATSADPAGAAPNTSAPHIASPLAGPAAEAVARQDMAGPEPSSPRQGQVQGGALHEDLAGSVSAPAAGLDLPDPRPRPRNSDSAATGPAGAHEPDQPLNDLEQDGAPLCTAQTRPATGQQAHAPAGGLEPGDPLLRRAQEALAAQLAAAKLRLEAELREKRKALSVRAQAAGRMWPFVLVTEWRHAAKQSVHVAARSQYTSQSHARGYRQLHVAACWTARLGVMPYPHAHLTQTHLMSTCTYPNGPSTHAGCGRAAGTRRRGAVWLPAASHSNSHHEHMHLP